MRMRKMKIRGVLFLFIIFISGGCDLYEAIVNNINEDTNKKIVVREADTKRRKNKEKKKLAISQARQKIRITNLDTELTKKTKEEYLKLLDKIEVDFDEIYELSLGSENLSNADKQYLAALEEHHAEQMEILDAITKIGITFEAEDTVFFGDAKWKITTEGKNELDKLVQNKIEAFKKLPSIKIIAWGYADERSITSKVTAIKLLEAAKATLPSTNKHTVDPNKKFLNRILSQERAKAVANYLMVKIKEINSDVIIEFEGKGEELPCKECTYGAGSSKRRVVMYSITPNFK